MDVLTLDVGVIDLAGRRVHPTDGAPVRLTAREVQVLRRLARTPGETVTRIELEQQLWGLAPAVRSEAVPVAMRRLRGKVERDPTAPVHLHTVQGEGWALTLLPAADPDAARTNLGSALESFVGREAQLLQLRSSAARWVTLVGPPGVGRTRLVVEAARAALAAGEVDEAWRVDGTGVSATDVLRDRVAGTLGADVDGLIEALSARGRVLLVIDDLDVAVLGPALSDWLGEAEALRLWVVATRRAGHPAEHLLSVQPLTPDDASTLLEARAAAVGAVLSADQRRAVVDAVDRLPVAIELVAAQAHLWPPEHLIRRGAAMVTDRLTGAVQRALDGLPSDARAVVGALASFSAPFSVEGAVAVAGDEALDALALLADRALVQITPGAPLSLRLLGPVRRVADTGTDEATTRHASWMLDVAEREAERLGTADRSGALERLLAAEPDLELARTRLSGEARIRLALALDRFFAERGAHRRRRALLADLEEPLGAWHTEVWAQRAIVAAQLGELEQARAALQEASLGEPDHPRVLRYAAFLALRMGEQDEGLALARRALERGEDPRRTPEDAGMLWAYVALAHTRRGERGEAEAALRSGLAVCAAAGALHRTALLRQQLGDHYSYGCDYDRAVEELERAADAFRRVGVAENEGRCLVLLAMAHAQAGRVDEADEPATRGLSLLERVGDPGVAAESLNNLADIALQQGRYDEAERLCVRALQACARPGLRRYRAIVGFTRATVARLTGAPDLALRHLEAAVEDAGDIPREGAWTLAVRAALLADRGDLQRAEASLQRARELAIQCGDPLLEPLLGLCGGHLELARGDAGAARRALQEASAWLDRGLDIRVAADLLRNRIRAAPRDPDLESG